MTGASITVSGNITADPELRYTQNGIPVASLTVAHTPRRLNRQTNQWEDAGETLFLRVSVWREQGENIAQSLHKGDAVLIIGSLVSRSYKTREGEDRTSVECDADIVSIDLRRQRAQQVARVKSGETGSSSTDAWAAPGADVTPIKSTAAA